MPVLHHYKDQTGAYVKAWVRGSIVTFQLNRPGHVRLQEAGLADGSKFPLNLLIDLLRDGEAFTRSDDAATPATRHEAEQFVFDFAQDLEDERIIPVCEETGQIDDLHLVVHGEPPGARLLSPVARRELAGIALSIPLALINLKDLTFLAEAEKVPPGSPCLDTIRAWLTTNLSEAWRTFAEATATRQQDLGLTSPDELGL